MSSVTANELKTKGINSIKKLLQKEKEVVVTVRGESKYVIVDMEHYNYLRDCELNIAVLQVEEDIKNGNYTVESANDHIDRLKNNV